MFTFEALLESATSQSALEMELIRKERERQDALVSDDMERLASLLTDDLVHVHATGMVQGKPELLVHAGTFLKFESIERGDLKVRLLAPEVAVMTGDMVNTVRRRDQNESVVVRAFVTQIWVRDQGDWKIASFHAVRTPDLPPANHNTDQKTRARAENSK